MIYAQTIGGSRPLADTRNTLNWTLACSKPPQLNWRGRAALGARSFPPPGLNTLGPADGRVRHGNAYAISLATGRPVTLLKILFIETFKFFNSLINIFRLVVQIIVTCTFN